MPFTKEDFNSENAQRLTVIINKEMGLPPLTSFMTLPPTKKNKFNRLLNAYIQSLGDDWSTKLMTDFNTIVNEDILNEDFQAKNQFVPICNTDKVLLLSEEQKEWIAEQKAKGEEVRF